MQKRFNVGDLCYGQNFEVNVEYNGMVCEIIGGLQLRRWHLAPGVIGEGEAYLVRWATGEEVCQYPYQLRLIKPSPGDGNTIVSWDSVGWSPYAVPAEI